MPRKTKKSIARSHPNATAAGVTGSAITVIAWFSDQFGVTVPIYVAAAIVTLLTSAVLFVGKRWS